MKYSKNDFENFIKSKYPNMVEVSWNGKELRFHPDSTTNSINSCYVRETRSCPVLDIINNV